MFPEFIGNRRESDSRRGGRALQGGEKTIAPQVHLPAEPTLVALGWARAAAILLRLQVVQNLGLLVVHCDKDVAGGTIVGNRLPIRARVTAVVAAEAACGIVMAQVVRMGAPGKIHRGENVSRVNGGYGFGGLLYLRALGRVRIGIAGLIEIVYA